MQSGKTTLERAFELAASGEYADVSAIRAAVKREGYSISQMVGGELARQLRAKIREAVTGHV